MLLYTNPAIRVTASSNTLGPIVGYRKDGRPIFPIRGGSEPPNQPPVTDPPKADPPKVDNTTNGPEMVTDEHGTPLYPKNTAIAEMTPVQQANYWRAESKKQQRLREEAERKASQSSRTDEGSGTVRDQQQSSNNGQPSVSEIEARVRREAGRDAAAATIATTLQSRGKNQDEITELVGLLDLEKFLDENGKLDGTKVANYVARVAPATGSTGTGGNPGQGNQGQQGGMSARDRAKFEAEKRGLANDNPNRGALGGLRK